MKTAELREMTVEDLKAELSSALHNAFNLRMKTDFNAKEAKVKVSDFKKVRRGIARIKTILSQKAKL